MLLHLAKILEISGFMLATIFGGILLNREMFGRFANKVNSELKYFSEILRQKFLSIFKFAEFLSSNELTKSILGATMIRGISLICIVIGWLVNINWLFWIGVIFASPYLFIGIISVFFRIKSRFGTNRLWLYPILLCWSLILSFVLAPTALFIYLIMLYTLLFIWFSVAFIAREDSLKKGLIILGSILIIVGLILETIIIW